MSLSLLRSLVVTCYVCSLPSRHQGKSESRELFGDLFGVLQRLYEESMAIPNATVSSHPLGRMSHFP